MGVPIIGTRVFWGLYWGSFILGNYHVPRCRNRPTPALCPTNMPSLCSAGWRFGASVSCFPSTFIGVMLGIYWGYIGVILGIYWGDIRAILGIYWGYLGGI